MLVNPDVVDAYTSKNTESTQKNNNLLKTKRTSKYQNVSESGPGFYI